MKIIKYSHFCLLATLLILVGCQTVRVRGQLVDEGTVKTLQESKLTKAQVTQLIGSPSFIADSNPNIWYYVQRSAATRAWGKPIILNQQIVEVFFDQNNITSQVKLLTDTNIENTHITHEYTRTKGTELNSIQKFVRGIGRFNSTTDKTKKKSKK